MPPPPKCVTEYSDRQHRFCDCPCVCPRSKNELSYEHQTRYNTPPCITVARHALVLSGQKVKRSRLSVTESLYCRPTNIARALKTYKERNRQHRLRAVA